MTSAALQTTIREPKARSAGNQPRSLVVRRSRSGGVPVGDGDAIAQEETFNNRPIPLSYMTGRVKTMRNHRGTEEEQEALLPMIDSEEDGFSSHRASLPSIQTSQTTLAESFLQDGSIENEADLEASLEVRQRVAPDQFVEGYETTKWEVWAYYGYYVGNTGLTLAIFGPMAMQNLLELAAGEEGMLLFLGRHRTVNSIALMASAISFSLQIALFLVLGSFADFGSWRSGILIVQSVIGIAIGFVWLGLHDPEQWRTGIIVNIVGLIAYQTSIAYFFAAFPALARNTPALRKKAKELSAGIIGREEYDQADSKARNDISNMALWFAGAGGVGVIAVMMAILYAVEASASPESNSWGLSLIIGFGSAVWLAFAIPWFVLEKRRPGQQIPAGMNILTAGFWQMHRAAMQMSKLRQSLAYLITFFILGESLSTSITVISLLQIKVAKYDMTQLSQLIMMQFASATIGMWICIKFQQRFAQSTKTMLCGVAVCIVLMNLWGMVGIWSDKIGYHNIWEFWAFGFWLGFFVNPWYSYSQTMISEVTPRGKDYLFFSLFNIIGKASSFIGPLVSSIIIDATPSHNPSTPFSFLTALSVLSLVILIFFVDLAKSRMEQDRFLEDERLERVAMWKSPG